MGLIDEMLGGSERALSKLISILENDEQARQEIIKRIYVHTGNAATIGFTGPPGVGKSTTINAVAQEFIKRGKKVGIIAVDPSSPFTKGAVLGDRIRMQELNGYGDLYIRSLASRGKLGGISKVTNDVVKLLDAFGKDIILIETVGTGQSEFEIAKSAHTTVIVLSPGNGDGIQAIKAGILETGNIFIINKSDMKGSERTIGEMNLAVGLNFSGKEWMPPVVPIQAKNKIAINKVVDEIENHYKYLINSNKLHQKNKERISEELNDYIISWVETFVLDHLNNTGKKELLIEEIYQNRSNPVTVIEECIKQIIKEKVIQKE